MNSPIVRIKESVDAIFVGLAHWECFEIALVVLIGMAATGSICFFSPLFLSLIRRNLAKIRLLNRARSLLRAEQAELGDPAGSAGDSPAPEGGAPSARKRPGAADSLENLLAWESAVETHFKALSLRSALEEPMRELAALAARKGILVENRLPAPAMVHADIRQIRIVFRNLLSNALKFTPRGGKIAVEALRGEKFWRVTVCDTGVGMEASQIEHLFKDEICPSTSGTENEEGVGIGLQICRAFILNHGGVIEIKSRKNVGTVFHFTLRIAESAPKEGLSPVIPVGSLLAGGLPFTQAANLFAK